MKIGLVSGIISLFAGGGAAAAAVKKAKPKRYFFVVPYGHIAYKQRFGNPVKYRWGPKKGEWVERQPGLPNSLHLPLVERLACIDLRVQKRQLPLVEVMVDGINFYLLPIISFKVVRGFEALYSVADSDWHTYLMDGCAVIIGLEAEKLTYQDLQEKNSLEKACSDQAKSFGLEFGIEILSIGFRRKAVDPVGLTVTTRAAYVEAGFAALREIGGASDLVKSSLLGSQPVIAGLSQIQRPVYTQPEEAGTENGAANGSTPHP